MLNAVCAQYGMIQIASTFQPTSGLSTQRLTQTTEARRESTVNQREAET
jgi:hypothetical protein